jgi:hypothetical protein
MLFLRIVENVLYRFKVVGVGYVPIYPCNEAAVQKDLNWMACKEEAMFVVGGIFTTRENAEIIGVAIGVSEASCVSSAGGFFISEVHDEATSRAR